MHNNFHTCIITWADDNYYCVVFSIDSLISAFTYTLQQFLLPPEYLHLDLHVFHDLTMYHNHVFHTLYHNHVISHAL